MKKIILLIVGLIVIFVLVRLVKGPARDSQTPDEYAVISVAEKFVKNNLKAPSTAEFSPLSETSINIFKDNSVWVDGYVDAQNSFGAMIRSKYSVKMIYNPYNKTFTLKDISIK